ncbi:hypothetical protein G6F37_002195 [Rhizopus arrhizus]|nr:hypothetical protein G6F38_002033 [Rhizopus arrhizus]KAG1162398.1 hypothetical protein G6F37_002195 [Rhizopus arrhizus]
MGTSPFEEEKGQNAVDCYVCSPCEYIDGLHGDVLYVPTFVQTETFPPVVIEIQHTVDKPYLRRLMKYCGHIIDKYQVEPIALTICTNAVRKKVTSMLEETTRAPFMKKLPSYSWAQNHFFISEATIASFLDTTPLPPIVALAYVMIKQEISLLGLEHRDDATVKMLYAIAKESLDHEIHNEEKTVEVLLNVCKDNSIQYKRILEALKEDSGDIKRARLYANDGLLYVETCLKKYSCHGFTSTMPEPLPLPEAVVEANNSSSSSSHQTPLRAIETEKRITDMEWIAEFIDNYTAEKKKMNWQVCFDIGQICDNLVDKSSNQRSDFLENTSTQNVTKAKTENVVLGY